jgi:hypothetical protein
MKYYQALGSSLRAEFGVVGRANVEGLIITEKDTYPTELEEVFDAAWAVIRPRRPHRLGRKCNSALP